MLDAHLQKYGVTALAVAAYKDHEQVVDVLLKAGANPDIQAKVTATILWQWACMHAECIVQITMGL